MMLESSLGRSSSASSRVYYQPRLEIGRRSINCVLPLTSIRIGLVAAAPSFPL